MCSITKFIKPDPTDEPCREDIRRNRPRSNFLGIVRFPVTVAVRSWLSRRDTMPRGDVSLNASYHLEQ